MTHAYLILAHDNVPVLNRLIDLIDDPRNAIYLHLDSRLDCDVAAIAHRAKRASTHVIRRRPVHWGHYSQVEVAFRLLEASVPRRHDYYHVLSGSDLPLAPPDDVHDFFHERAGREFVGFAPTFDPRWATELHVFNRYMRPANRAQRILRNRVTANLIRGQRALGYDHTRWFGLTVRKGSDWHSITHALAEHTLSQEKAMRRLLRLAHAPNELYMQTIVWSSPFRERLHNADDEYEGSARLVDWERGEPYVFRSTDFRELASSDRMFARKFRADIDMEIVQRMYEHVSGRQELD